MTEKGKKTILVVDDEHKFFSGLLPIVYNLNEYIPRPSLNPLKRSKYNKHQGEKEKARRLKQLNRGQ